MFNIKDAVGWVGNIAVFGNGNGGYILIDWPLSQRRLEIK